MVSDLHTCTPVVLQAYADAEFRVGHAPIHPVVKIGTPQGSDVTATKRRSIVPSVGDSLTSSSFPSLDDLNNHCPGQLDPNAYLSAHPNGHLGHRDDSPDRRPSVASSGVISRDSTSISFIDDFPSPPNFSEPALESNRHTMPTPTKHASAFGQLVTGPPGAGKTTYCHGMHQVSSP